MTKWPNIVRIGGWKCELHQKTKVSLMFKKSFSENLLTFVFVRKLFLVVFHKNVTFYIYLNEFLGQNMDFLFLVHDVSLKMATLESCPALSCTTRTFAACLGSTFYIISIGSWRTNPAWVSPYPTRGSSKKTVAKTARPKFWWN